MALTKISTDGVKDDAITKAKIPADQIEASELANNAVDTNAIADQAVTLDKLPHGDSNNNGKFLRANNGADPSFETVSIPAGTTINNNADNRVITGSGSANTLEGEAKLTFDGDKLIAQNSGNTSGIDLNISGNNPRIDFNAGSVASSGIIKSEESGSGAIMEFHNKNSSGGEQQVITLTVDRNLQINDGNLVVASNKGIDFSADGSGTLQALANSFNAEVLHDYEVGTFTPNIQYDTGTNQYYGSPGSGHYVSTSKGEYIRIGDMMFAAGQITLTGNRNSTQTVHISIGGMPYNGLHSSQQSSLMHGWGGAAWPKNDSNSSYRLYYSYHNYTTLNFAFQQTAGNNGIDGFRFHVYYRCTT